MATRTTWIRLLAVLLVAAWLIPVLAVGFIGLGKWVLPAVLVATGVTIVWILRLRHHIDALVDALAARHAVWLAIFLCAALAAVVWTTSLSVFMQDPARVAYSIMPTDTFRREHSCFSAYAEGTRFAAAGDRNIYEAHHYGRDPTQPGARRSIAGTLRVDPYHYPPPFLLLPRTLAFVVPDFIAMRAVWFTLQALLLAIALQMVARWIGCDPGAWASGAAWLVLASPPVVQTLQQGNFQITAVALAMIGLVLVDRGRIASGAVVLAYATLSKFFPGAIVLLLLAARRWRAAIAVGVAAVLLTAATIALFGTKPMIDFVRYELPRIASTEAFPQVLDPARSLVVNGSVLGQVARFQVLRSPALASATTLDISAARTTASIYGIVVLLLIALAGWRLRDASWQTPAARLMLAQLALAAISLVSFRSPFVGSIYAWIGTMWMLTLLAAGAPSNRQRALWMLAFVALAAGQWFQPSPRTALSTSIAWIAVSSVAFLFALLLNVAIVLRVILRGELAPVVQRPPLSVPQAAV